MTDKPKGLRDANQFAKLVVNNAAKDAHELQLHCERRQRDKENYKANNLGSKGDNGSGAS